MTSLISGTVAADDDSSTDRGLMAQRLLAISSKDTISLVKVNEAFLCCVDGKKLRRNREETYAFLLLST